MKKRTLVFTDRNKAAIVAKAWEKQKEALQAVIDLYTATGLPELIPGDLDGMFNDTVSFLFDKLTGGQAAHLAIGSGSKKTYLPVNKENAIAIMEKPVGYEALLNGIKEVIKTSAKGIPFEAGVQNAAYSVKEVNNVFVIDEISGLQFSQRTQNIINEAGNYYISSEAGNRMYEFVQSVVKAYYDNEIDTVCGMCQGAPEDMYQVLKEVIERLDDESQTVIVRGANFAHLDSELNSFEAIIS